MRTIWQSLLWKEWREHQWKLAALTSIVLATAAYIHFWEGAMALAPMAAILFCIVLPGAMFVAMGVAAGERSGGTMDFVRALPVGHGRVAAIKLFIGAVTCAVPAITLMAVELGVRHFASGGGEASFAAERPTAASDDLLPWQFAATCSLAAGAAVSVFVWSAAAGVRQPTELRAGLAAVLFVPGWLLIFQFMNVWARTEWANSPWLYVVGPLAAATPGAGLLLLSIDVPAWQVVVPQLLSLGAAAAWTVSHYGRVTAAEDRSPAPQAIQHLMDRPARSRHFRSQWAALAWKQLRESLPFLLAGVAATIGFTLLFSVNMALNRRASLRADETVELLMAVTGLVGVPLALIVGVGNFVPELRPGLWTFWRSRPIAVEQWFASKFLTGAGMLLCLHLPVLAFRTAAGLPTVGYVATMPLVHLLSFSIAVCIACVVRKEIYAAILALGVVVALTLPPVHDPRLARISNSIGRALATGEEVSTGEYLPFLAAVAFLTALATLIAWLAVRYDWGRK